MFAGREHQRNKAEAVVLDKQINRLLWNIRVRHLSQLPTKLHLLPFCSHPHILRMLPSCYSSFHFPNIPFFPSSVHLKTAFSAWEPFVSFHSTHRQSSRHSLTDISFVNLTLNLWDNTNYSFLSGFILLHNSNYHIVCFFLFFCAMPLDYNLAKNRNLNLFIFLGLTSSSAFDTE